jgi:hypothetical protein
MPGQRATGEVRTNGLGKAQSFFSRLGGGIQRAFRSFGQAVTHLRHHGAGQTPNLTEHDGDNWNPTDRERLDHVLSNFSHDGQDASPVSQSRSAQESKPKGFIETKESELRAIGDNKGHALSLQIAEFLDSDMYKNGPYKAGLLEEAMKLTKDADNLTYLDPAKPSLTEAVALRRYPQDREDSQMAPDLAAMKAVYKGAIKKNKNAEV